MGKAADAALAVRRIRPTEQCDDKSPYMQALNLILTTKRRSSEATAMAFFLAALAEESAFTTAVQACREQCGPAVQKVLANAVDHYMMNGVDSELREVVGVLGTRYDLPGSHEVRNSEEPAGSPILPPESNE